MVKAIHRIKMSALAVQFSFLAGCAMNVAHPSSTVAHAPSSAAPPPSAQLEEMQGASLEFFASTAGPYGDLWTIVVTPDGSQAQVGLKVLTNNDGAIAGTLTLTDKVFDTFKAAVVQAHLCNLPEFPKTIDPDRLTPLHGLDLFITVSCGPSKHQILLSEPQAANSPEATRFLTVWYQLLRSLPMQPSWSRDLHIGGVSPNPSLQRTNPR